MTLLKPFIAVLGVSLTCSAGAAESDIIHYDVNLAEIPGAKIHTQVGARTSDGRCLFSGGGSGKANGTGQVLVITEVSFNPTDCSRKLARAVYPRDALPPSVAQKVELETSYGMTQRDASETLTPGGGVTTAPQAAVVEYIGSLKVNVEDPPQIDVTTTKSRLRWSNSGSRLNKSYHNAHWGWYSPSGWRRTNAHWDYGNNGSRAYTDTYGKYRNGAFCATIDAWTEHKKTYFEGRPYGAWSWSYKVHKWGGCSGLLHYEYILETP